MALNKTTMANFILGYINALSSADIETQQKVMEAFCQGIIDEITTNGVVTVTSVSGVTTGGGVSGPGSGTIS